MYAFDSTFGKQPKNYNLSDIATKSGFKFRDHVNRKLDWKTLGCVDVNKIVDNQDYEFLERIVPKLIEAPMQSILSTAVLDPAVSSLFRLAQLSLQYLSFCQQFMDHTLFDLKTAFNHSQKKYSNLKHNYKLLEEQHYKAQERIHQLLELNGNNRNIKQAEPIIIENHVKPTSPFSCDQCTKNFLTADSLKSHQQRKHSTFEEKHELSDDNEKEKNSPKEKHIAVHSPKPKSPIEEELKQHINDLEPGTKWTESASDTNNDVPKESCAECLKKSKVNSSSVAIQCEEDKMPEIETEKQNTKESETKVSPTNDDTYTAIQAGDLSTDAKQRHTQQTDLIQSAYDTINELKQEILELRNALKSKQIAEIPEEVSHDVVSTDSKLNETNDKIECMAQKFDAFETMYTRSQNQFIESFRNLDEQQKNYMNNIQETVKEIVEESIGKYSAPTIAKRTDVPRVIEKNVNETVNEIRNSDEHLVSGEDAKECIDQGTNDATKNGIVSQKRASNPVEVQKVTRPHESESDWTSECEEKLETTMICQADVHTVDNESDESLKPATKTIKEKPRKKLAKEVATNEFEQRLRQLGINADSVGLSTPRSQQIIGELADEREEMKRAFKPFKTTRHLLENEVDRIAKGRLRSANSVTSLSSVSHFSDDHSVKELDNEEPRTPKLRPKSANIQKIRKRNAKKLVKKYVENDIDESDIMNKMEMAQKAITAHRECIQELLQTTAHAPKKITRIKYPVGTATTTTTNGTGQKPLTNGTQNDNNSNQYNKMPNVTTRRVVFVNLDEDS